MITFLHVPEATQKSPGDGELFQAFYPLEKHFSETHETVPVGQKAERFESRGKTHVSTFLSVV